MSFFNNNFVGANYGYPSSEGNVFDGYPSGNDRFPDFAANDNLFDLDGPEAGPSRSQDWYLNPSNEGYRGSTLLDVSGNQFMNPYTLHADTHDFATGMNVNGLSTYERTVNIPAGSAGMSVAHLATAPFQTPATFAGPITPPLVLPQQNTRFLPPTPSYAAGTLQYGAYEQPLAGPSSTGQWSHIHPATSADKGKARATDYTPPTHPTPFEDDAWRYQQPRTTENHGTPIPQTVPGVPPNTDFPSPIAPSYGPQRSEGGAKGKAKATRRGRGKRKRDPSEPLSESVDSSWEQTKDRFVWELLEVYHFRPAGRSINPETAFASLERFIKEDLHRSPLAAKAATAKADKKESRVYEQYLTHILKELRRSEEGEAETETLVYTRVLQELGRELAPINGRRILREGHSSNRKDSNESDDSRAKVKHRQVEQERRAAIRSLQDQISAFFLVPGQKKVTTGELLLFVVVYLRIGRLAFPGLIRPRPS
ncbi:hypothetical protein BDM02DRAFT_3269526 [Thelephora ganbajun]|uniref:Uncharacterized protein n=1 Tax=Thelephora ganbajun TaxID=370292 RepID=A0ACB6ZFS4_THEGA|nr:hypothetical protein BDM02DRAFT_3269526 [Thelephora ganbajun]